MLPLDFMHCCFGVAAVLGSIGATFKLISDGLRTRPPVSVVNVHPPSPPTVNNRVDDPLNLEARIQALQTGRFAPGATYRSREALPPKRRTTTDPSGESTKVIKLPVKLPPKER